jgi:hypothetical protein
MLIEQNDTYRELTQRLDHMRQKDYTNRFGRERKTKTTLDLIKEINSGK